MFRLAFLLILLSWPALACTIVRDPWGTEIVVCPDQTCTEVCAPDGGCTRVCS